MTMPTLPIPPLEETAQRYLKWVQPLLNKTEYRDTEAVVNDFVVNEGVSLQQDLTEFAKQQNALGKSWLSDAWLDSYLAVREPLPLSTSGAFRLSLELPGKELTRIAFLMAGLATQCADYLNGQLTQYISARGEQLDIRQWLSLRGIGRIPQPKLDRYEVAPLEQQTRYAIVFWQSQPFALEILDTHHRVYAVDAILAQLRWIVSQTPTANPISDLSRAPADTAAVLLTDLAQHHPTNKRNFELLAHSLFHVHLSTKPFANSETALAELTFLANEKLWAYKPMTVCANLESSDLYIHLEHGSYDAGALQAMLQLAEQTAQQLSLQASEAEMSAQPAFELKWQIPPEQATQLATVQSAFNEKAKQFQVRITNVAFAKELLPERTSIDCIMQLIMQYAQLKTFGEIRNTYEAVDVSHFQAGRTECVRPVSCESIDFIRALTNNRATPEAFESAHQEHKNRIKACKQGHGVNRHLLGLQLMAKKRGIEPAIFTDKGYKMLTTDCLSTSTLGDRRIIGDFAFKPTVEDGLGVTYFLNDHPEGFLYCISFHENQSQDVQTFIARLSEGAQQLTQFFQQMHQTFDSH